MDNPSKVKWLARTAEPVGLHYGLAVVLVAVAFGIARTYMYFRLPQPFTALALSAIAITFWYGGAKPGILATLLSMAIRNYCFDPGVSSLARILYELVFLVFALLMSLVARARNAERTQTEEELRRLSGDLLRSQDEERRRIARDLHDDLGQSLFSANLNLRRISLVSLDERTRKLLSEAREMIRACMEKVRTIAHLLHPPELERLGLRSAIVIFVNGFRERSGIQVDVAVAEDLPRLPRPAETALFRVTQECLLNIQRHSKSSKAWIRIGADSKQVILEIRDEGIGMNPPGSETAEVDRAKLGVGLEGISARMQQLGGRLEITSGSWGTSVKTILPLDSAETLSDN
ncbi:MAG: sensor histidine kinase [Candidatus Acidiferrales bacterium]